MKNVKQKSDRNDTKVKVKSAEIVVHGTVDKPYFEIKYYDMADGEYHIGYGSYNLDFVFEWLEECFEIVGQTAICRYKNEHWESDIIV